MARIRTIKPEFWTDEKIVECSLTARLLFIGLWTFSDDRGVHQASSKRLKMEVFPGDDISSSDVDACIGELLRCGLIREFAVEGQTYWHIVHFRNHQKIEKPTFKHPEPPNVGEQSSRSRRGVGEESANPRQQAGEESAPEGKGEEGKGRERNGNGGEVKDAAVAAPPAIIPPVVVGEPEPSAPASYIAETWCACFGGTLRVTEKRRKAIRERWRDQWWRENWQSALEHAVECPFLQGQNDRGWRIDFDFFLRPDTATKILEGKYDGQPKRKQTAAEAREALNASGFDWIRQAAAADAAATSGSSEGGGYLTGPGATLFE